MRFAACAASVFALPLVAACGDGTSDRAATDSAASAAERWTIDTTPRLRLTQQDTVTFEGVQGITVLPDGGVVVASYVSSTLRYFEANGDYVRSVGREGKGPGERVLGRFLLDSVRRGTTSQGPDVLVRGGDSTERQLGVFPSRRLTRASDGKLSAQLYTAENRVAVFDDGFCAGYGGGVTITCHDVDGALQHTITLTGRTPVAVSDADRESYFDEYRFANSNAPKEALDAEVAVMRERLTFAESLGLFGALRASRDGLLWVGPPGIDAWRYADPSPLPAEPTAWSVYTRTGRWVATVTLPARFFLWEAGADYVVGVTRDADDAEVVVVYSLRR